MRSCLTALALACALTLALAGEAPAAANRPPVVMLTLDEFPLADITLPDGRIDAVRFPGFAALAAVSTWFPNATTVHDATDHALPAILDGRMPRRVPSNYRGHPRSIFRFLHRAGYRVDGFEEASTVCPPRLCPRRAHYGNPEYNVKQGRHTRMNRLIARLKRLRRGDFVYRHSLLPHQPWVYLPSGRAQIAPAERSFPAIYAPATFGDELITAHLRQRHLLQVGYLDRQVGRIVRRLKAGRHWKSTVLVVTSDHGVSFEVGTSDRRQVTESNMHEIAPVPLFVKRVGQTRGRVSRAYVRTVDIPATVAGTLRRRLPWPVDGRDAFGSTVAQRSEVAIARRDLSGIITLPAREMQRRRQADRQQRAAALGTGRWSRVFAIGPNRHLLGRPAPGAAPAGAPVARFMTPRSLRNVNTKAAAVPTLVTGWLDGGTLTGGRDLAVAMNGRVVAVGRSFHIDVQAAEWFSVTIPESALKRGRNTMALYEVVNGTDLRLLGEIR